MLTVDLKKAALDWQDDVDFDGVAMNEMAFEHGIIPSHIGVDETAKYMFAEDVDAQKMTVSGKRNLVAISCDANAEGKCTRLLVLDINLDQGDGDESEDEDDDDDDTEEVNSSEDQDSDLEQVIDID